MHELIIPKEIKFSEIKEKNTLSPSNFKYLSIRNNNRKMVKEYLDESIPFEKGVEPGSAHYVKKSEQIFLRNSCINNIQYSVDKEKYIYLNPNYYSDSMLASGDILFCTDANIGDCCLYIEDDEKVIYSSGIVKLNFKEDIYKYYVVALMRDDYFRLQLDAKTPKGATIRHSGNKFLECEIPVCNEEWVLKLTEALIKNVAYAEYISNKKLRETEMLIEQEIIVKKYDYLNPSLSKIMDKGRLDAGIYSNTVFQWINNIKNYKNGYSTLEEYGFKTQRGPSLQKRDLGRSIQSETYRKGYNVLIYPSDISSSGYIENTTYLGARNPIWFLSEKYILFSSEGTVGKTFIICDNSMRFTTNIHGTMIYPKNKKEKLSRSIFLGLYLNYLRCSGVFSNLSVGGNGGSFAVGYWDNILIPNVDVKFMDKLSKIYSNNIELNPLKFNLHDIQEAGIYQLNTFLIKCKELLKIICSDLKNDKLQSISDYESLI